jgi:hypothetical protein
MSSGARGEPPRRALLAGWGALGLGLGGITLTGCTGTESPRQATEPAEHDVTARRLRRRTARDSAALLARYDATVEAHPELAGTLAPLRTTVTAHLTVLAADTPTGDTTSGDTPAVPPEPDDALGTLADAERHTAGVRSRALTGAPPELARLLASMAAAGSAQAYLLTLARTP